MIGRMIISPTKSSRSCQFFSGIATSISCLSSSGLMSPMRLVSRIAKRTTAIFAR
jgi:hypothetical protein